jgi:hypothetical protein
MLEKFFNAKILVSTFSVNFPFVLTIFGPLQGIYSLAKVINSLFRENEQTKNYLLKKDEGTKKYGRKVTCIIYIRREK